VAEEGKLDRPNGSRPLRQKLRVQQLDLLVRQLDRPPALPGALTRDVKAGPPGSEAPRQPLQAGRSDSSIARALLEMVRRRHPERRIQGLAQALEVLDFENVTPVLLCVKVMEIFNAWPGALDRRGFWSHCLAVATAAEMAARRLPGTAEPLVAFACGLLHDVGKVTLDACLPKSYGLVLGAVAGKTGNIADAEKDILGVDHALVGRRLAQHWRLARRIEEVIWLHHHPGEAVEPAQPRTALIRLVQLADTLAREQRIGFSGNYTFAQNSVQLALTSVQPAKSPPGRVRAKAPRPAESAALEADAASLQGRFIRELRDFAGRVGPATSLPQLCWEIARTSSAVFAAARRGRPTCAFCFSEDDASVFVAAYEPGKGKTFRLAACRPARAAPPDRSAPAGPLLRVMLNPPDAWTDLIDPDGYLCLPLVFEGRWLGGILIPAETPAQDNLRDSLCEFMAFALAAAAGRHTADRLAEQLARASEHLARTREAMAQNKALEAVGEMAAGAAHELNNPLAVISGRAQMIARGTRSAKQREAAELIVRKVEEISRIASELMEFARPRPPQRAVVAAADLLKCLAEPFPVEAQPKAGAPRVDIRIEPGCPPLWVDAGQIGEVLVELVRNASQAAGGRVNVRAVAGAQARAEHVLVQVMDDGPGMDEATLASAFTPFFSLRPAGRGRGLGLARAKRAVEVNGGRIWIESQPGSGTTVFLELPQPHAEG